MIQMVRTPTFESQTLSKLIDPKYGEASGILSATAADRAHTQVFESRVIKQPIQLSQVGNQYPPVSRLSETEAGKIYIENLKII